MRGLKKTKLGIGCFLFEAIFLNNNQFIYAASVSDNNNNNSTININNNIDIPQAMINNITPGSHHVSEIAHIINRETYGRYTVEADRNTMKSKMLVK